MAENVLITGGTGLIGSHLAVLLRQKGHNVWILSRSGSSHNYNETIRWDPDKGLINTQAVSDISCIIHLAGANIAGRIWTKRGRRLILDSRVNSGELLLRAFNGRSGKLKTYISASGVNYYGSITSDHIFRESDPPAKDFLGNVCRQWEEIATAFNNSGVRSVVLRTAVVIAKRNSVLQKLKPLFKLGLGTFAGTGNQYFPWIHIHDLCQIYLKAIEDGSMSGPYNAVAPGHITMKDFVYELAGSLNRKIVLPPVPSFVFGIIPKYGAQLFLEGSRISSDKLKAAGFSFRFEHIKAALENLIKTD